MRKFAMLALLAMIPCLETPLFADAADPMSENEVSPTQIAEAESHHAVEEVKVKEPVRVKKSIAAFTGKITKNRVRMRLQPTLDAAIIKELKQNDMVIVDAEMDDFYVVRPAPNQKSYVFRTFVLDGVVEGTRVNVRLEPNLESPIIAQLNSGDRVKGMISPLNSKWMEIETPEATRFYVAKEFVENIGGPNKLAEIMRRKEEVEKLFADAQMNSKIELQKSYEEIHLDTVTANLNKIMSSYNDFAEFNEQAKTLLAQVQDTYTKKKLAYLEAQAAQNAQTLQAKDQMLNQMQFVKHIEENIPSAAAMSSTSTIRLTSWAPAEEAIYALWAENQVNPTIEEFYRQQEDEAVVMRGVLEHYSKTVKNKPGDYVLLNPANNLPIAYLYSTSVMLQDKVGQQVTVKGATRPNNNFAFPAYYVLSAE